MRSHAVVRVAAAALGALAWGTFACAGESAPSVPPAVAATGVATERAGGTVGFSVTLGPIRRDGYPVEVATSRFAAFQGGAFRVMVAGATSGSARLLGVTVPLAGSPGALEAYLPVPTGAPIGPATLRVDATDLVGIADTVLVPVAVLQTDWTVDYIVLPPGVGSGLTPEIIRAEEDRLAAIYAARTPTRFALPWHPPIAAIEGPCRPTSENPCISGYFGEQRSFNGGPPTGHHGGTDIAAAEGEPVMATNAGTVVIAEELAVRGNMVIVDHGGGVLSGYAHLSAIAVAAGQVVAAGEVIGAVGTTGLSTGNHLHWELAVQDVLVDGLRWVDGSQGF